MKDRSLAHAIREACFPGHKMAFISGPRQCGKTTLGKALLKTRATGAYYNWDDIEFRRRWTKSPKSVLPNSGSPPPGPKGADAVPMLVLDEIHKGKSWKRTVKGVYDTMETPVDILVTGSARLNVYRRGSDSLLGRYYHLRLHPFSLRETETADPSRPDGFLERLFGEPGPAKRGRRQRFDDLMRYGGFPEPLFAQDARRARLWRNARVERVIREDLRDLTRIPELGRVEMMASLLPGTVGSLLSMPSLGEDLEVSYDTVKRWLASLAELYYVFELKPWQPKVRRTLRKASKLYMWDYSEVDDPGARFENLVAAHLLKTCHFWTDTGEGVFDLHYLRNKQKNEIDFLITRDNKPWLPVEAKLRDAKPSPCWRVLLPQIGCVRALQIVAGKVKRSTYEERGSTLLVADASDVLHHFA